MESLKLPLSNLQLELLRLFSHNVPEQDLMEIRENLAQYFAKKTIKEADKVWKKNKWKAKDIETMLSANYRKPYKTTND